MKNKNRSLLTFLLMFAFFFASAQKRGDLINTDLIASWTPEQQKSYMKSQLGTDLPIDENLANTILDVLANGVYAYVINIYKVKYWTQDLSGKAVRATGAMVVPQNDHGKTMILFSRGHVYDESDVFSNLRSGGGSNLFATAYGMIDFIVLVPDNIGCGDGDGREKGFNHIEGANAMVDMYRAGLKATSKLSVKRNGQVFVGGYSQGGGNAMATIKYLQETGLLWNELPVHSAIFGGGPYDFSNTTLKYSMAIEESIDPEYYFMFIRGADDAGFPIYDNAHDHLNPEYWDEWDYYIAHDIIRKENIPNRWKELFKPEAITTFSNPNGPLFNYARTLDVYDWQNHISILMTYGTADTEVPYQNAIIARDAIRNRVPWYNFWEKWIVNTTDFGAVDHRTAGAYTLLSTLAEFGLHRNAHNLANPSNYSNGVNMRERFPEPLFTTTSSMMNPTLALKGAHDGRLSITNVKVIPVADKHAGKEVHLTGGILDMTEFEPGIYCIEARVNGKRQTALYLHKKYELITAEDNIDGYFPLQQENGIWSLDLNYMDNGTQVTIFNQEKKPVYTTPVGDKKEVTLPELKSGIYTVEVLTNENAFYLELRNTSESIHSNAVIYLQNTHEILFSLRDPNTNVIDMNMYNLQGNVVQSISNQEGISKRTMIKPSQPGVYIIRALLSDGNVLSRKIVVN